MHAFRSRPESFNIIDDCQSVFRFFIIMDLIAGSKGVFLWKRLKQNQCICMSSLILYTLRLAKKWKHLSRIPEHSSKAKFREDDINLD